MTHPKTICEQCGRVSRLITYEQAYGKTFQMVYQDPTIVIESLQKKIAELENLLIAEKNKQRWMPLPEPPKEVNND